jgi:tRNA G18 (ribose-2'-O)-methylase SpoU
MSKIIIIAHNIRSTHNIGAIFRTAEGFGVHHLIFSGYSPYPKIEDDARLPHIAEKLGAQIRKTALGAEGMVPFSYQEIPDFKTLREQGYRIVGLEQDDRSTLLNEYTVPDKVALLIGEEVAGIEASLRDQCDDLVEIPMSGKKESFNVSVATGIALYALTSSL